MIYNSRNYINFIAKPLSKIKRHVSTIVEIT